MQKILCNFQLSNKMEFSVNFCCFASSILQKFSLKWVFQQVFHVNVSFVTTSNLHVTLLHTPFSIAKSMYSAAGGVINILLVCNMCCSNSSFKMLILYVQLPLAIYRHTVLPHEFVSYQAVEKKVLNKCSKGLFTIFFHK